MNSFHRSRLPKLFLLALLVLLPSLGLAKEKQTVLITGANRGLGLEMAKHFVAGGYEVIGTARKPEKATDLKQAGAEIIKLDVTSEEDIAVMVKTLEGRKIDILINNAGYFGPNLMTEKMDSLETLSREEMERCYSINTMGPIFVTQALLPNLRRSSSPKVVNISTRAGMLSANPYGVAWGYRVSKAALNMVTRTMSADQGMKGMIVVSIAPGHNKTDMGTSRGNLNPAESMAKVKKLIEGLTPQHHGGFWFYDGSKRDW